MRRVRLLGVVLVLGLCVIWSACSTAWVGEAEQIVGALIPGITNLLTLVGTLEGKNISAEDLQTMQSAGAQAEADLQLVQSLIGQYQKADAAAQPGLLNQMQVAMSAVQSNLSGVLPALHIKDAATQAKVTAVVGVLLAEVQSVAAILPEESGAAPAAATAFAEGGAQVKAPFTAKEFVGSYNAAMTKKTGEIELDRAAAGLQIHLHGKFARWASAGLLK
jgi:hypothetical protein